MVRGFALSFAVLLAVFEFGSCLQCHQCNSASNPECSDPLKTDKFLVDCRYQDMINYNKKYLRFILPAATIDEAVGTSYCAKIIDGTGLVARTCLNGGANLINSLCHDKSQSGVSAVNFKHCSICDKDKCNGSSAVTASLPVGFLALLASFFFYKY